MAMFYLPQAAVVIYLKGHTAPAGSDPDPARSFLVELLFTFALAYVVLNVATSTWSLVRTFVGWPPASRSKTSTSRTPSGTSPDRPRSPRAS